MNINLRLSWIAENVKTSLTQVTHLSMPVNIVALLVVSALTLPALAQSPTELNLDLWSIGSASNVVYGDDGGVYITGGFELAERQQASGLVRLNSTRTLDDQFQVGFDSFVYVAYPAKGGGVFVGGDFENVNNQSANRLTLIDDSGAIVNGWNASANGGVFGMESRNTFLYISGLFTEVNGEARSGIARLNLSDGGLDNLFSPSFEGTVVDIEFDSQGRIWIGGLFSEVNGQSTSNLVLLDEFGGVLETYDIDAPVRSLEYDENGFIYVCGDFETVQGQSRTSVARFAESSVTVLDAWQPAVNDAVFTCVQDGQDLLIGGDFTVVEGMQRSGVARLHMDGSLVSLFSSNVDGFYVTKPDSNGRVLSLAAGPDDELFVGGLFGRINDEPASALAMVSSISGDVQATYELERRAEVRSAVTKLADESWLIGGQFRRAGNNLRANLLRLLPDGDIDSEWPLHTDGPVRSLKKLIDGSVIIGGFFGKVSDQRYLSAARISDPVQGVLDENWRPPLIGSVAVVEQDLCDPDQIYLGGFFAIGENSGIDNLVNFANVQLSDGLEGPIDLNFNNQINDFGQLTCDELYVGGSYNQVNGMERRALTKIRLEGSGMIDSDFNPDPNGTIWSILALPETDTIIVSGEFTTIFGAPRARLAKFDSKLTPWNPSANGPPVGLVADGLGWLYAAGTFTQFAGQSRRRIAKISLAEPPVLDMTFNPGANGPTLWDAIIIDSSLVVTGNFTQTSSFGRRAIASFIIDVLRPDFIFSDNFEQPTSPRADLGLLECRPGTMASYKGPLGELRKSEQRPVVACN